jgi:hypothetical protein
VLPNFIEAQLEAVARRLDAHGGWGAGMERELGVGMCDRSHEYRKNSKSVGQSLTRVPEIRTPGRC